MAKRLTDIAIRNLKPDLVRREIPDPGATGLYLVLQPSGVRSFAVRYRFNSKSIKLTVGKFPTMTLADARKAAADAQAALARGANPATTKQTAKVKAMEAQANTVASVCAKYLAREHAKLRISTASQRESIFRRLVYPAIGERPIGSVRRSELTAMLDKIEDASGPRMADVALAVLRRVFTWHALRDDNFLSPIVRGMNRQKSAEHRRSRILDDDELRAVWAATEDNAPFSALVRFLLLTSARRTEASAMKRDEVDADGIWVLPASRSKTKTEVTRPLSKAAQEILAEQPHIDGCDYVFSATGRGPFKSYPNEKQKLDAKSGVVGWRLHDLRRTARSLLSRAGVNSDVAEKSLGHSRGDIIERYDRHKYLSEMAHAFELLSAEIERIVHPPTSEVADMAVERGKRQQLRR
jgi:integrase